MSETDDEMSRRAELSAANLKKMATIGFVLDIVVSAVLIIFREELGLGELAFLVAALIAGWGLVLYLVFPKLPVWGLRECRARLEDSAKAWEMNEKK